MYLLDTDICSYAMRRRAPQTTARISAHAVGELKVSVVTQFELEYGARRSERSNELLIVVESFLANVEILPFDFAAARHAAIVRAALASSGSPIGQYDMLIAGHALSLGATLVTNNVDEFRRVEGLQIENWAE
jgi:tRNA(fMet)-specific endonuclease VapC